ncbi:MAG: carbamoyltransferase HypF [Thermoanaerobaculia bacterium]|nr:carbamoyltransferase HypF [Thermoanaerobaculia bacterium]
MPFAGRHIEIRGVVQGVGFRPFVHQAAHRDGITGRVRNDSTGVVIDAFGETMALEKFTGRLATDAPPAARIADLAWQPIPFEIVTGFEITASAQTSERNISIPPDLAICDDCLREVLDPADRRYLYPFTNCTNCGPRYSIVRDIPYDRAQTTMARFEMCGRCQAEYDDPLNRRFHAQPNACPDCGPRLTALDPSGIEVRTSFAIGFAARALKAQLIVALKGIGGFHLACDATSAIAVRRLRERKRRDAKPLAVMVRDLAAAEAIAALTNDEKKLLASVERPIVLAARRGELIAPAVSGDNPLIGIMLAYTPLHHILLAEAGTPLVMTSGNLSEEPMAYENAQAIAQLGEVADLFLVHDREIETRVDDSVARVIAGTPTLLRRGRGYVPGGVRVTTPFDVPVLACGAHLKNAVCIGTGRNAFLGPHVGDLETVASLRAFEASIEQMKRFIGVEPTIIAHDLHPDYLSTRYAEAQSGVTTIAVQHHHAHIVSAMAEHHLSGPVIGFAYDGAGFGTDGTSWGGEVLIVDERRFTRAATFRPIALAGGDQAIRQVWRIALALLDDAFEGEAPVDALPLFGEVPRRDIESVRRMIQRGVNTHRARGVGRYFDALGSIGLGRPDSRYEGEVAFLWNMIADPGEKGLYPVVIREGAGPWEIDPRTLVRAAVLEFIAGRGAATVSARFHNTIARATVEIAQSLLTIHGEMPVILSGGCFQNARLTESVIAGLAPFTRVYTNHQIPPGDGGIALGQAVIANAIARAGAVEDRKEVALCV